MSDSETCPLCASALKKPKPIEVCANCHAGLQMSRAGVSSTGEFTAITDPTFNAPMPGSRSGESAAGETNCCWCNKTSEQVRKMLSQGAYHICNECVSLCADILRMELGDDFA